MIAPYYQSPDGRVTLYCGDCLEVMKQLEPGNIELIVTDPPYGIGWSRGVNSARNSKAHDGIQNDQAVTTRDSALCLFAGIPAIVFGSFYAPYPENTKQVLVWHKPADAGLVGSTTGYRRDAEPIFLVGPWPNRHCLFSSVFHVLRGQSATVSETGHPHTKPIDLLSMLLGTCGIDGEVIDPFMGSGTTGVACIRTNRRFIGIEIDEHYCEIAAKRIQAELAQGTLALEVA